MYRSEFFPSDTLARDHLEIAPSGPWENKCPPLIQADQILLYVAEEQILHAVFQFGAEFGYGYLATPGGWCMLVAATE
jgi:hypothetical protein